ncbi:hypothetical protein [Clostridium hydrogeniformans]|uniref:hypothetical protein n=1 Tax=Clostridium hydrogeniformans TaxID=349933 RepID=UPI0004850ED9|nr:hypothetical protein [Clostridium hydrogeniformans]
MDIKNVIAYLSKNDLSEAEEIAYKGDAKVVRFFYDFDKDEIEAARAYSNDECTDEEESNKWYDEYFLPYINDLAIDNVGEIVEEIMDEFHIDGQFISYDADSENYDYNEFIAIFFEKGKEFDIEEVLDSLNM